MEHLLGHLLAVSGILDKSTEFTDNSLNALLRLKDGHVHVLGSLDQVAGRALI